MIAIAISFDHETEALCLFLPRREGLTAAPQKRGFSFLDDECVPFPKVWQMLNPLSQTAPCHAEPHYTREANSPRFRKQLCG